MATNVFAAFEEFYNAINLTGDHREIAGKRRDRVIELIGNRLTVLEAFATGSIPRYTALREHADLDVIVALHFGKHIRGNKPSEVLQLVRDAFSGYRTSLRRNGQAVTLYYNTWPSVDVVPVSRVVSKEGNVTHYAIPDMNSETWISARPKLHSQQLAKRAALCGANFRRVIKIIKHWNERKGCLLQSYHIEVMALRTFVTPMNDITWEVFQFFSEASTLASGLLFHEADVVDAYLSWPSRISAVAALSAARDRARSAWHYTYGTNSSHREAIEEWRAVLGNSFPTYG